MACLYTLIFRISVSITTFTMYMNNITHVQGNPCIVCFSSTYQAQSAKTLDVSQNILFISQVNRYHACADVSA